tara:strand:+ start:1033 stop:1218 length:186 start_codon:yes stop_codon:yes gene_type:complete
MARKKLNLLYYLVSNPDWLSDKYKKDCEKFLINLGNKQKKFVGGYKRSNFFINALRKGGRL